MNIPYNTLKQYVTNNQKIRKIGNQPGREPLIRKEDSQFLAEINARKDSANNGTKMTTALEYIQNLNSDISSIQAQDHFACTLCLQNSNLIKIR